MKIIYLKDCYIKAEKNELIAISKIKFNGLSIVDIIRDKFSSKYKIKFLSTSEKDLTSLITSNENILEAEEEKNETCST